MIELDELRARQSWTLDKKIFTTQSKIMQVCQMTHFKIAVSFSGGKDSAILLDQVGMFWAKFRELHGNKPLVVLFANTKNEFSGMIEYVQQYCRYIATKYSIEIDLRIVEGKQNFYAVIHTIGYPVGSKKIARQIRDIRKWMRESGTTYNEIVTIFNCEKESFNKLVSEGLDKERAKYKSKLYAANEFRKRGASHVVVLYLTGINSKDRVSSDWRLSKKWRPLMDAPFEASEECCAIIKKQPIKSIEKELELSPVIGEMADDGKTRETSYLKTECNAFRGEKAKSKPMGFWLEQDVLKYIARYNIPIFKIYGKLECKTGGELQFTGEQRTGCKLCMFGIQFPKRKEQFKRLAEVEPNTVRFAMKDIEDGGLGYGKVITYLNKYCGCNVDISGLYQSGVTGQMGIDDCFDKDGKLIERRHTES